MEPKNEIKDLTELLEKLGLRVRVDRVVFPPEIFGPTRLKGEQEQSELPLHCHLHGYAGRVGEIAVHTDSKMRHDMVEVVLTCHIVKEQEKIELE